MDLCRCEDCGHIFNGSYTDELVDYETDYENSQMFSPRFRKYAEDLSEQLVARYDLHRKHVVEIGGGKGDFLRILCALGDNCGVSVGPSYRPGPGDDIPPRLRFVTDYYGEKYGNEPADLIVCRHVLEHLSEPRSFVSAVRGAVGDRQDLVVYLEVPNGDYILRNQAFWEFIYQHCSYFTRASLTRLFTDFGFTVRDIHESFGDQFLAIEASAEKGTPKTNGKMRTESNGSAPEKDGNISSAFCSVSANWREKLGSLRARGKRVMAWRAGAKAVTFLNIIDPTGSAVSHIVDINPRKEGRFIPGSGQQIVAPNALQELRPDAIILMNRIYRNEVSSTLDALGFSPEILIA